MYSSVASVNEAARQPARRRRGGWIAFPFIIGTMAGLTLSGGWIVNLIMYLKEVFQLSDIEATKIYNYVNGSVTMFPIVGAIIADSLFSCFSVLWFSSLISLLGIVLLLLTTTINQLRPPTCNKGSNPCTSPSQVQFSVLYLGLILASLGTAGSRFTIVPIGADQFDNPKHQGIFFNWYIFTMYVANIISSTAIVYVEENVSWALGLTICTLANVLGLAVFLSGYRFYRFTERKGSPFKSLARVIVAAISKRKLNLSLKSEDYYHDLHDEAKKTVIKTPTHFFRFLNHAALRTEGDTTPDGSIVNPWKLCTLQQVEDLKRLIKISPIWSSGLILSIPIAIQMSFIIFQAKTMDARLGPRFKVPPASMQVFTLISTSITIVALDRLVFPLWAKLTQKPLTPLQRIGIGHFFTVLSMAISALVESKRLKMETKLKNPENQIIHMSVFWLVPQLASVGIAEAFHFAGQVALYYQEFPESLKSTSTAAVAMSIGGAFYLSNVVIAVMRSSTDWLPPDGVNKGRLDNVYWAAFTLGAINYVYFLVCASFYKYQNDGKDANGSNRS